MGALQGVAAMAVIVQLVIGLSGVGVGLTLLAAMLQGPIGAARVEPVGLAIAGGVVGYGALVTIAAIGMATGRRGSTWASVVLDLVGLAVLGYAIVLAGPDEILGGGVLIWLAATGLVLAVALNRRRRSRRVPPAEPPATAPPDL